MASPPDDSDAGVPSSEATVVASAAAGVPSSDATVVTSVTAEVPSENLLANLRIRVSFIKLIYNYHFIFGVVLVGRR